jgi:serine/threonine-protein kinase HipA
LKTAISEVHGNALDVDAVVDAATFFDVDADDAVSVVSAMASTIKDEWRAIGAKVGMTSADLKAILPATENAQIERALALGKAAVPGAQAR